MNMIKNLEEKYKWLLDMLGNEFGKDNVLTRRHDYGEEFSVGAKNGDKRIMFYVECFQAGGRLSFNKLENKIEIALDNIKKIRENLET